MLTVLNFRHRVLQSIFGFKVKGINVFIYKVRRRIGGVLKLPFQNKNETFEMLTIKQRGNDQRY